MQVAASGSDGYFLSAWRRTSTGDDVEETPSANLLEDPRILRLLRN
jgi:hypothetical protein